MPYHCCPILLDIGSIILPGNYGRIINLAGPSHDCWMREQALEEVRRAYFPNKPSRLESAYVLESLETAQLYHRLLAPSTILYDVELVEPNAIHHRGDYNCVQPLARRAETMEQVAHLYWEGVFRTRVAEAPNVECVEFVTLSPIRVRGMVST